MSGVERDATRLRKIAEADCGCRIPAPFDEVADHIATVAEAEGFKRGLATQGLDAATIERCARRLLIAHDAVALAPDNAVVEAVELRAFGDLREALALNTASTTTRGEDARLREALSEMVEVYGNPEAGEIDRRLAMKDARAALQGDAAHTSQEKGNG